MSTPLREAALAAFGGFEIAMMTGAMLAAASQRRVLLIDGIISSAACLVAARIPEEQLEAAAAIVSAVVGDTLGYWLGRRYGFACNRVAAIDAEQTDTTEWDLIVERIDERFQILCASFLSILKFGESSLLGLSAV